MHLLGHNPLSARYHLEGGNQASLLTINLSQHGLHRALVKNYDQKWLENLSVLEYEQVTVDYIKSNFELSIDEEALQLGKGGIKLGTHQTDLKFVLPPIVETSSKVEVRISAFKESENHQTIFSYTIGDIKGHEILSSQNEFSETILFEEGDNKLKAYSIFFALLLGVVLLIYQLLPRLR